MQDNYLQKLSDDYQVSKILKTNEESKEYGLSLSEIEATNLVVAKRNALKTERREHFSHVRGGSAFYGSSTVLHP